ncbi:MAG: hypothetical protein CM15mP23_06790 [Cryomorphaceae bacterium]|nr:MAG: hypothetical protein CM15mP23_06790 [Cryomorphaceae bacterium]
MNVDSIIQLDLAELINLESLKIRLNDNLESVSGMNNLNLNLSFTSFIGNPNLECLEGIPPFYDLAASAPPLA